MLTDVGSLGQVTYRGYLAFRVVYRDVDSQLVYQWYIPGVSRL